MIYIIYFVVFYLFFVVLFLMIIVEELIYISFFKGFLGYCVRNFFILFIFFSGYFFECCVRCL